MINGLEARLLGDTGRFSEPVVSSVAAGDSPIGPPLSGILKQRQAGREKTSSSSRKGARYAARGFPPAIEKLAHKHRLGTPEHLYTHSGSVRLLFGFPAFWVLFDLLFSIALLSNSGRLKEDLLFFEVILLGITALCFSAFWYVRSFPDYCRCTEGFLALKRGNPPKLLDAVRWDDVTSTRRVPLGRGQYTYYVRTRPGKEIQIRRSGIWDRSTDIWDHCNQHVHTRKGNSS